MDTSEGPDGCWPWQGSRDKHGYGSFYAGRERGTVKAYAFAWELVNGRRVRPGFELHHRRCNWPPCCNPTHLAEVSHRVNLLEGETTLSGRAARAVECPHGHPYDEANTIIKRDGSRACRACKRRRDAAAYAALSEEERERRRARATELARERYAADPERYREVARRSYHRRRGQAEG